MYEKAVKEDPYALKFVLDQYKTREMCGKAVEAHLPILEFVPDKCKTQEMYDEGIAKYQRSLIYVPDWFVTQEQVKIWHDEDVGGTITLKNSRPKKCK